MPSWVAAPNHWPAGHDMGCAAGKHVLTLKNVQPNTAQQACGRSKRLASMTRSSCGNRTDGQWRGHRSDRIDVTPTHRERRLTPDWYNNRRNSHWSQGNRRRPPTINWEFWRPAPTPAISSIILCLQLALGEWNWGQRRSWATTASTSGLGSLGSGSPILIGSSAGREYRH